MPELDELRGISRGGKQRIAEMEEAERARTGIGNLKIRYNRVFGYYIEISKSNLGSVPADYHRKQTIAGGERFITPALKEYEEKVLGADERIVEREVEIFDALRGRVAAEAPRIQDTARALAALDVLAALAETAAVHNYTKPLMHDGDELLATDARHPVVERHVADAFVPNDVTLDAVTQQLIILTGPNMGGKSTYLRQCALLCLMAQAGSFVPARQRQAAGRRSAVRARRRVRQHRARAVHLHGRDAGDGQHPALRDARAAWSSSTRSAAAPPPSTASASPGRSPSTWRRTRARGPRRSSRRTTTSSPILPTRSPASPTSTSSSASGRTTSCCCARSCPGRADRSYGIQVARLAGLPPAVVARAREILTGLERDELSRGGRPSLSGTAPTRSSSSGCSRRRRAEDDPLRRRLRELDVNHLTPMQALTLLAELKDEAGE